MPRNFRSTTSAVGAAGPVRYGRDVLPILSANCFAYQGLDQRLTGPTNEGKPVKGILA